MILSFNENKAWAWATRPNPPSEENLPNVTASDKDDPTLAYSCGRPRINWNASTTPWAFYRIYEWFTLIADNLTVLTYTFWSTPSAWSHTYTVVSVLWGIESLPWLDVTFNVIPCPTVAWERAWWYVSFNNAFSRSRQNAIFFWNEIFAVWQRNWLWPSTDRRIAKWDLSWTPLLARSFTWTFWNHYCWLWRTKNFLVYWTNIWSSSMFTHFDSSLNILRTEFSNTFIWDTRYTWYFENNIIRWNWGLMSLYDVDHPTFTHKATKQFSRQWWVTEFNSNLFVFTDSRIAILRNTTWWSLPDRISIYDFNMSHQVTKAYPYNMAYWFWAIKWYWDKFYVWTWDNSSWSPLSYIVEFDNTLTETWSKKTNARWERVSWIDASNYWLLYCTWGISSAFSDTQSMMKDSSFMVAGNYTWSPIAWTYNDYTTPDFWPTLSAPSLASFTETPTSATQLALTFWTNPWITNWWFSSWWSFTTFIP